MVEHGGLSHYLSWVLSEYPAGEGGGAPAHSPVAFDLTVTSLLAPLAAGSQVVLVQEGPGASRLLEVLQREDDFGLLKLTPAHLEALEVGLTARGLAGRARALIVGGEALRWKTVRGWRECAPETRIINEYGPTEAVVGCCTYEIKDSVEQIERRCEAEGEMVPIGRAIAGSSIYVVDARGWLTPQWIWGELWIGGGGLARGYLGEPELTAERFVPDPFAARAGARCYRSGDRGRWGAAGQLDYGGRVDRQVKVRGYRIELGEIEAVVGLHADVGEAIVVAGKEVSGEARLVCYVTPKPSHELRVAELREYLQSKFPGYMVPSAFVTLNSFPLTPNGKVDRRALPAPEASRNLTTTEIIAPRTPAERLLAEVWAGVLGLDLSGLSVSDNFFELGGDSILAIKVVVRANAAGLSLASGQLFRHQTIAELAAAAGTSTVVRAQQDTVIGAIPLTPIQHWFFENPLPNPHHFNQSLMVEVRQKLDPKLLEEAVRHLVAHHDVLRLRFTRNGSEWKQHTEPHVTTVPFRRVDVSRAGKELSSVIEVAATEAQTSLNLSDGPLIRIVLFDAGDDEPARLLIVVHHLAIDIVSWGAVLEDFHEAYAQLSRGASVRLPAKTTSYKDWAERLQRYAHSEELRREAEHWLTPSYHSVSRLPVDYPDSINNVASARTLRVSLDEDETGALLREIPRTRHAQIHEVLLTALGHALASWTRDSVALVNIEGHGREEVFDDVNLSRTVGWFTAIYPILIDVSIAANPEQTLSGVMNLLRRTPNGGLGYGVLRYLGDEEIRTKLTSIPQPEVIFNYQGQAHQHRPVSSQFRVARESSGPDAAALGQRRHLLDVNAGVANECLNVHWTYSENVHRRSTIEKLAEVFIEALRDLIARCRLDQSVFPTRVPDFAQAGLDERTLQNIMAMVKFD
jgi:non-ribosomal peptide synthase protein (TIGR01720 family)